MVTPAGNEQSTWLVSLPTAVGVFGESLLEAKLNDIFFKASATQEFKNGAERSRFRDRWLGRYLRHYPEFVTVALDGPLEAAKVAGYLVGSVDDPLADPIFRDIDYFTRLAPYCAAYPAHLHINLSPGYRGRGLGGRLVHRFAAQAFARGAPGLHIVTGAMSRNISFYKRLGMSEIQKITWSGSEIVMLGDRLPLRGRLSRA